MRNNKQKHKSINRKPMNKQIDSHKGNYNITKINSITGKLYTNMNINKGEQQTEMNTVKGKSIQKLIVIRGI